MNKRISNPFRGGIHFIYQICLDTIIRRLQQRYINLSPLWIIANFAYIF